MKANHRMYSLPYNGTNPEWFLQEAEKRKNNIDHVYCELPLTESNMFSHVRFLFDGKKNTGIFSLTEKRTPAANKKQTLIQRKQT